MSRYNEYGQFNEYDDYLDSLPTNNDYYEDEYPDRNTELTGTLNRVSPEEFKEKMKNVYRFMKSNINRKYI